MRKGKGITWLIAVAIAVGAGLAGCSSANSASAPCWTSGDGSIGNAAAIAGFVTDCAVSPADTYMVNLASFLAQPSVRSMSQQQVVAALHDWRQSQGDDMRFLLRNPASTEPIADLSQVRFMYVHGEHSTVAMCEAVRGGVLVDFDNNQFWSSAQVSDLLASPVAVQPVPLGADARSQLLALVESDANWTQAVGGAVPSDWIDAPTLSWQVVIVAGDYSLHNYQSPLPGKAPANMDAFLLQFQTILGISVLTPTDG